MAFALQRHDRHQPVRCHRRSPRVSAQDSRPDVPDVPKRSRAVLAQLTAVLVAGATLALFGQALVIAGVALALPSTEFGFLVSAGSVARLLTASMIAGAVGAVLGAGLGALIRTIGGAVTTAVLVLFVIPPLAVQLISDTRSGSRRRCSP